MDYKTNIYHFKNRFFKDANSFIVFSDKKEKLMNGVAEKEAKLFFVLERYNHRSNEYDTKVAIFADSIDEVEFILSAYICDEFDDCCELDQFNNSVSINGYAMWKHNMENYRLSELTRRGGFQGTYITKRTYNLLDFLEERAEACAGAHAQSKV